MTKHMSNLYSTLDVNSFLQTFVLHFQSRCYAVYTDSTRHFVFEAIPMNSSRFDIPAIGAIV